MRYSIDSQATITNQAPLRTLSVPHTRTASRWKLWPAASVRTAGVLLMCDVAALACTTACILGLYSLLVPASELAWFTKLWPAVFVGTAVFALWGLYPGIAMHPAEEIRRTTLVILAVTSVLGLTVHVAGNLDAGAALLLTATSGTLMISVPAFRAVTRQLVQHRSWWGYPVAILGAGDLGRQIVETLQGYPALGLRPVAVLDDNVRTRGETLRGIPVLGGLSQASELAVKRKIPYAILAVPQARSAQIPELVERHGRYFQRLLVFPGITNVPNLWTTSRSFNGLIGFEIKHLISNKWARFSKRTVDIIGAVAGILLLLPVAGILALAMKLDSAGGIFFRQVRMGKDGRCFRVIKFRSMYLDADQKLQQLLNQDPDLRYEYETFHKLRNDPRVTRLGRILRRYSLDELPQLWNVLKGDMSLVGPRAYLPVELSSMEGHERVILKNPPGLTGLWQVSGRNDVCFSTRVHMDVEYIRNWSIWLDIYILARTLPVVFTGKGAA